MVEGRQKSRKGLIFKSHHCPTLTPQGGNDNTTDTKSECFKSDLSSRLCAASNQPSGRRIWTSDQGLEPQDNQVE